MKSHFHSARSRKHSTLKKQAPFCPARSVTTASTIIRQEGSLTGAACRRRQDLDAKGLLAAFATVKQEYEKMEPAEFNDDANYQFCINEVGLEVRQAAGYNQLYAPHSAAARGELAS